MKVIDCEDERHERSKIAHERIEKMMETVRAMPVNERTDVLVSCFSVVVSEFAQMVLDHTDPSPGAKSYARRVIKKSNAIRKIARRRRD